MNLWKDVCSTQRGGTVPCSLGGGMSGSTCPTIRPTPANLAVGQQLPSLLQASLAFSGLSSLPWAVPSAWDTRLLTSPFLTPFYPLWPLNLTSSHNSLPPDAKRLRCYSLTPIPAFLYSSVISARADAVSAFQVIASSTLITVLSGWQVLQRKSHGNSTETKPVSSCFWEENLLIFYSLSF